jgi:hypothetical protein
VLTTLVGGKEVSSASADPVSDSAALMATGVQIPAVMAVAAANASAERRITPARSGDSQRSRRVLLTRSVCCIVERR